jgi:hypothetical protein
MYFHLDIGNTAFSDIGNFLVIEDTADDQGKDVPLFIAKLLDGSQNLAGLFPGDVGLFLIRDRSLDDIFMGNYPAALSHLVIKKITADGKKQCRTLFMVRISLHIEGKGLLGKIGGRMRVAGLAKKIPKEFVPVIGIKLSKSIHSISLTDISTQGYTIS